MERVRGGWLLCFENVDIAGQKISAFGMPTLLDSSEVYV